MAINKDAKAAPSEVLVSMAINSFTHGGLIDDVDVEITDALTCEWDYNGQQEAGPALAIEFTDQNGTQHVQYYSAGKAADWKPSSDSRGFVSVSGKTGINDSTNLAKLLQSLSDAGFPMDRLEGGDLKLVVGLKCHVNQVAQERKGLVRTGKNADRPSTTLLVTKIHSLPGEKGTTAPAGKAKAAAGGKANGAAKEAPAAVAAAEETAGMDETITGALMEALPASDGPIAKKAIPQIVFKAFSTSPDRNKAIARSTNPEYLKSLEAVGITFDGSQISMG